MTEVNQQNGDTHLDSQAMAEVYSSLSNPVTGIGTSRSKTEYAEIGGFTPLPREVLATAPYVDEIFRNAVFLYPESAAKSWFEIHIPDQKPGDDLDNKIMEYLRDLGDREDKTEAEENSDLYGASEAFKVAECLAQQFGAAYILMGIDDGQPFDKPIDRKRIKSIRWLQVLEDSELRPYDDGIKRRKPIYYELSTEKDGIETEQLIHHSRVLPFLGREIYSTSYTLGWQGKSHGISKIQGMYDSYKDWLQAMKSASAIIADINVFILGIRGLGRLLLADKQKGTNEGQEQVLNRAHVLDMGKSVTNGFIYDLENEKPDSITRRFNGLDSILTSLLKRWAATTRIPIYKLLGEVGTEGLTNNQGLAMRAEWALLVQEFACKWVLNLERLLRLAFLAKDSPSKGKPRRFEVIVPYDLQLTDLERMEFENKAAERTSKLIGDKVILPHEARAGYTGATFSTDIVLDQEATEIMTKTAIANLVSSLKPDAPVPPDETPQARQDDATPIKRLLKWNGLEIGLQYFPFDKRHGRILPVGYGHIRGTRGADGMAEDVYVGTKLESPKIFAISQVIDGEFDELKYFIGVESEQEAERLYKQIMPPEFFGGIQEVKIADLNLKKP